MVAGDLALGTAQPRVTLGARRDVGDDAALVEHRNRGVCVVRRSLDAVARVTRDGSNRRVEGGERAQGAVTEAIAARTGTQKLGNERHGDEGVLGPGDADGDGLGLVLDGVDGPGQLLDAARQRVGEVLEEHRRRAHLAVVELVDVERDHADRIPQQRPEA